MDNATRYRRATEKDALTICELGQLLNDIHHAARPDVYTAATLDYQRDLPHWMNALVDPAQAVFIAEVDSRPAGFITASLSTSAGPLLQPQRVVRIGSVCVAKAFWGQGIGRGLVQEVRAWASEHAAQDVRLMVWAFNEYAIRLYTELGFETRAFEMGMRV